MIGAVKHHQGQRYEVIDTFDRPRRDGTMAAILIWQSGCAECGAPFKFSSPASASKFQPNRRCVKHKRPGQRVRTQDAQC